MTPSVTSVMPWFTFDSLPQTGRFVILEHDHPFLHWDFMLEAGAALLTWRLHSIPVIGEETIAEPLADHRIEYLEYEGPVSGNRGSVTRWDSGKFVRVSDCTHQLRVRLSGQRIQGEAIWSDTEVWRFEVSG